MTSMLGLINIYRDFAPFDPKNRHWQASRLSPIWQPRLVKGKVASFNDYPTVGDIPAFSERAIEALDSLLRPNGELLLLETPQGVGTYHVFNVTTIIDALDLRTCVRSPIILVSIDESSS